MGALVKGLLGSRFVLGVAVGALLVVVAGVVYEPLRSGLWPTDNGASPHMESVVSKGEEQFPILGEVWHILQDRFVTKDQLDAHALEKEAIRGLLRGLNDPYTSYIPADHYELEIQDLKGQYEGIGAEMGFLDGQFVVIAALEGSPAQRAGILPGDVFLEVDGQSTEGMDMVGLVMAVRGPAGAPVELLVLHQGREEPERITIVREVIAVKSVSLRLLEDDIVYLRLSGFREDTAEKLKEALEGVQAQEPRAIILDLRNNPGGLLVSAVEVASQFLEDGLVLYEVNGGGERTDWEVRPEGLAPDLPMVVLVNGFSASGSEVVAGALSAHQRAALVGTRTFGKGSVNLLEQLSDGSGLFYTVAHWYTPDDLLIQGEGLEPDIVVEQPADAGLGSQQDRQLQQALRYLQERLLATNLR